MKRPHRRMHLMVWLIIAPVTAIVAFTFWDLRPVTPYDELPAAIQKLNPGEAD